MKPDPATLEVLVVVDMQGDFLTGPLGNAECAASLGPVLELLRRGGWDLTCFTRDTHRPNYLQTLEGRKLPVEHCIEGTEGWRLAPELRPFADAGRAAVVDKPTFGSFALVDRVAAFVGDRPVRFHLCGVCTGICVLSNAALLRARFPDAEIVVPREATADVTPEAKEHALSCLAAIQCDVAPLASVLARRPPPP